MLLYTMLYIVLAYLMLFAALTNSVCLNNASFFFLFKYFLCQGYELSGEIALKNNHYYYYYYWIWKLESLTPQGLNVADTFYCQNRSTRKKDLNFSLSFDMYTCIYMKLPSILFFRLFSFRSLLPSFYSALPALFIAIPHN